MSMLPEMRESPRGRPRPDVRSAVTGQLSRILAAASSYSERLRKVLRRRESPQYPEVDTISKEEGWEILDKAAKEHLDLTAEEFIKRWEIGEFENPDTPNVMRVAMLLPLAR